MIIEDEPQLVVLLEKHLKRLGYEVDAYSAAAPALDVLENVNTHYDLAVADMGLPDMPGDALLTRLCALRPALPVLVCSGSEFFVSTLPAALQPRVRFLQKPFLPRELGQKIEEILGPPNAAD